LVEKATSDLKVINCTVSVHQKSGGGEEGDVLISSLPTPEEISLSFLCLGGEFKHAQLDADNMDMQGTCVFMSLWVCVYLWMSGCVAIKVRTCVFVCLCVWLGVPPSLGSSIMWLLWAYHSRCLSVATPSSLPPPLPPPPLRILFCLFFVGETSKEELKTLKTELEAMEVEKEEPLDVRRHT
jgi:hypothetical protein